MSSNPSAPSASGKRQPKAAEKLKDPSNTSISELASHREARERALEEAAKQCEKGSKQPQTAPNTSTPSGTAVSQPNPQPTTSIDLDLDLNSEPDGSTTGTAKRKKKPKNSSTGGKRKPRKKQRVDSPSERASSPAAEEGENDSSSSDDEIKIVPPPPPPPRPEGYSPTADIDAFYGPIEDLPNGKKRRKCKDCKDTTYGVPDPSSCRRHIQAYHKPRYYEWCKEHKFASMLPKDRKAAAVKEAEKLAQSTIDKHLEDPKERVIPYSHPLFMDAALEWLIRTNQPTGALEHPAFQKMIGVASRCPTGVKVKIPGRKATTAQIMKLFDKNIRDLRRRLNSAAVKGKISITCDAWQASNQDAYFAVTGHWIEETSPGDWKLQSALLGFTLMNTAHDGTRLGRALYQIVKRLDIADKVGWITCDNASNNNTMLRYFATRLNRRRRRQGKKEWNEAHHHIRCLAHIINLATQAVLARYSKAKHYDPAEADKYDEDIEIVTMMRDVVGLVRAIVVKQRSSAKRTEMFKNLQHEKEIIVALVLLLDMKVRWSSTYIMLRRALSLKDFVNTFVYTMSREESNKEKRRKIDDLGLEEEEWEEVALFCSLLKHADAAQHAFSSETEPVLFNGLPALERLHRAWTSRKDKAKFSRFKEALEDGLAKIEEYYDKTSSSHAYTMAMVLDPDTKTTHFQPSWANGLEKDVLKSTEEIFKERWLELHGPGSQTAAPSKSTSKAAKTASRSRLYIDDSDSDSDDIPQTSAPSASSEQPWLSEFNAYINGQDSCSMGGTTVSMVSWWGAHAARLPTWASLARDYLAIMASSVSSERAFSAAGITISKRRNRLKGKLVEALQFLKCAYEHDLIFRDLGYTEAWELENEVQDDDGDQDWVDVEVVEAWDAHISVDSDADELSDVDV